MPFGVGDEGIAPVLTRVDTHSTVQVVVVVLKVHLRVGQGIEDGKEGGSLLVGLGGQERTVCN